MPLARARSIEEGQEWEAFAIGGLAAAAVVAVVICWRRPHRTLPLMLAVGLLGVVIGLVTAGRNHWIAATVSGGSELLAAALAWLGARGISGSAGPID